MIAKAAVGGIVGVGAALAAITENVQMALVTMIGGVLIALFGLLREAWSAKKKAEEAKEEARRDAEAKAEKLEDIKSLVNGKFTRLLDKLDAMEQRLGDKTVEAAEQKEMTKQAMHALADTAAAIPIAAAATPPEHHAG